MERFVGVEDAGSSLGRLVEQVAASAAGLDTGVIDEAIAAAHQL